MSAHVRWTLCDGELAATSCGNRYLVRQSREGDFEVTVNGAHHASCSFLDAPALKERIRLLEERIQEAGPCKR